MSSTYLHLLTVYREHLYRSHKLEIRCPRCCEVFESDKALIQHQRASSECPVRSEPLGEGFNESQEKRLRSRKRDQEAVNEEDKWRKVYRILFPDDDHTQIPTPCKI